MATLASAFPDLSHNGRRKVAGEKVLVLDGVTDLARGTGGQWVGNDTIYFTSQDPARDGAFMRWIDGQGITELRREGFNQFAVGDDGKWLGWRAAEGGVRWDDGGFWPGWSNPARSSTRWAATQGAARLLHAGTSQGQEGVFIQGRAKEVRLTGDLLVWSDDSIAGQQTIWGQHGHRGRVVKLQIPGERSMGEPYGFLVNGEPWVIAHTDTRLLAYPWESTFGYELSNAISRTPVACHIEGEQAIRFLWDAGSNVLGDVTIPLSAPRKSLTPLPERTPVLDTSGDLIDLFDYVLPAPHLWPRTHPEPDGHDMHMRFDDGRNLYLLPFPADTPSPVHDHWVRLVVLRDDPDPDRHVIAFREDHSNDGQSTGKYSFTGSGDPRGAIWMRRFMRPVEHLSRGGDPREMVIESGNCEVRYAKDSCRVQHVSRLPYVNRVVRAWLQVDRGPALGWGPAIEFEYDPGHILDIYERSLWAKHGGGNYRWQQYRQTTDVLELDKRFDRFGGRELIPTPGCWQPTHLRLRPTEPDPPDPDPPSGDDTMRFDVPPNFYLGAYDQFIDNLLPKDRITGRGFGMQDRVPVDEPDAEAERKTCTRGATAIYFQPEFNRGVQEWVKEHGRAPRNDPEWGDACTRGLRYANAAYDREQKGTPTDPGGGPGPGPGPGLPPSTLDHIDGQLQLEAGGGFIVNGRPVLPTNCHYGDALSKWMRDRDHVLRNMDLIASAGYHGIRYWTVLDGDWWNGRHVGESFQPNYWDQHRAFLLALKERGLAAHIAQGSLTRDAVPDRARFMSTMADVLIDVGPEVCEWMEGVNEARDTTGGERNADAVAAFVEVFHQRLPQVLCGLSAYTGTEDPAILNEWSRDPANFYVVHPYRGGRNHDKTRHLFSFVYENGARAAIIRALFGDREPVDSPFITALEADIAASRELTTRETEAYLAKYFPESVPLRSIRRLRAARIAGAGEIRLRHRNGINGEGPGIGPRVSAIDNMHEMTGATMCGFAAHSFAMRMAYNVFYGVGVISDDGGSQTFDQQPGFFDVPKVRTMIPADIMRYAGPIFHGGETWRNQRVIAAAGEVRADHVSHPDGRHVIGVYGPGDLRRPFEKPFQADVDVTFGNEYRLVVGRLQ